MSKDGTYNGWRNRATWCLALWLDNDVGMHEHMSEITANAVKAWKHNEVLPEFSSAHTEAISEVEGQLEDIIADLWDQVSTNMRHHGSNAVFSMFEDILNLGGIDYREIAMSWVNNMWDEIDV